jgi:outer membrane lipoprotein-sorting protein
MFLALWLPVSACAITSQDILQNVEQKLAAVITVKAKFEETGVWKLTGEKQTIAGEFLLKGEARFRISTDDQEIVSDGAVIWTYNKPSKRVLIDKVETAETEWLPQKLFLKTRKEYRHRLAGEEILAGAPCYVVELTPESDDSYITRIKVWVDKSTWIPMKIEQADLSQKRTVYTLSEVQTGIPVEDGLFKLDIPEGMEIIDLQD